MFFSYDALKTNRLQSVEHKSASNIPTLPSKAIQGFVIANHSLLRMILFIYIIMTAEFHHWVQSFGLSENESMIGM